MPVVVARYGYLGNGTPPEHWGADGFVDAPETCWAFYSTGTAADLIEWLDSG